ncbi:MAG: hypothetical protein JXB14_07865 [Candidatus Altiarchaeota archaeon]|nr:hypothetical protein [Candidatus Altiarchaeota archaeon]
MLILFVPSALATDYYVDDNCDGGGTGSLSDPFCTIAQAASLAGPGDTVYIKGGAYNEPLIPPKSVVDLADIMAVITEWGTNC